MMTTPTSELAELAHDLPVRARVCLMLLAGDVALQQLQGSAEVDLARYTLGVVTSWHKGERVDLDEWEDLFEDVMGFAQLRAKARSAAEGLAWLVLEHAICYATYPAFRAAKRPVPLSLLGGLSDMVPDYMDKDLRTLSPSSMALMRRASAYLRQHPDAGLAELKVQMSEP